MEIADIASQNKEPSVIWLQKHGVDFKGDVGKIMEMSIFPTETVNTSWIKTNCGQWCPKTAKKYRPKLLDRLKTDLDNNNFEEVPETGDKFARLFTLVVAK